METLNCPLCCSGNKKPLFNAKDLSIKDNRSFTLVKCRDCDLAYLDPRPTREELGSFYPSSYYGKDNKKFNPLLERAINLFRRLRAGNILKYTESGSVLDIGCGRGHLLSILKARGFEVRGTELTKESGSYARETLDIDVMVGDITDLNLAENSFNVVTMWHVFEHLPKPIEALKKIHGSLNKDGVLIVSVPNFGSLQSIISGPYWFHLDLPRHLYHFTPKTLKAMLRDNGYKVVKTRYTSLEYSYFGMVQSIFNLLGIRPNYLYDLLRNKNARFDGSYAVKDILLSLLFAPIVFPVGIILSLILDFTPLGGNLTVHARKIED